MGHPGHVEYVTDGAGVPYQYFHYSPWGESLISQTRTPNSTGFSTPYRFNAKELDSESGLFYYGARYYHPVVSQWLSVDPKANEFPHQSPYSAMDNNPVNKVDPDGQAAGDPPGKFGYVLGVRLGLGNSGLNFNLTGSIGYQLGSPNTNVSTFLSGSVYGGSQLGTGPKGGFGFDVSGGAYLMTGKGTGTAHNFYTLNYNTPSPFQNTSDLSVSWGQMVTYNSAINKAGDGPGLQTQGLFGMRLGNNFSLSYNNDATTAPTFAGLLRKPLGIKSTDAAWTGGITLNVAGIEAGYQNFSGYRLMDYPGFGVGGKYPQTGYHQSLNKASNFIQYNGMRLEYFSDAWFQNFIHNNISHESTYDYNYRGVNASGGTGTGN
ncbi:hypothetical protein JCM30197_21740 [Schleiferia thermophila]|nr:hypothetical protein JCM30197_21740 [Schleiferia thermophila]